VRATCIMCEAAQKTIIMVAKSEIRSRLEDVEVHGNMILKRVEI
jgi:hypothetical protein